MDKGRDKRWFCSLEDCGVELNLRLEADSDIVLVDGVQIEQVRTNLIKNAKEAMID